MTKHAFEDDFEVILYSKVVLFERNLDFVILSAQYLSNNDILTPAYKQQSSEHRNQTTMNDHEPINVLGTPLIACSYDPLTGYFRDGCCNTDEHDQGSHVICAKVTQAFLEFSLQRGNDLITPRPEYRFAGLDILPALKNRDSYG